MTAAGRPAEAALAGARSVPVTPPPPFRQARLDVAKGVSIAGFVGANGAGKTLLAVQSAIADMSLGRAVFSTVQIRSLWGDSIPITSLSQLLAIHDATILLDDIASIFAAQTTGSLPPEIRILLHTLRHKRNTLRWTAPQWARADTNIRGVTQAVVSVSPLLRRSDPNDPWPAARLVMAGLLEMGGKADAAPTAILRRRVYRPRSLVAFGAYDTHADTPLIGTPAQSGVCVDCGGSRVRPKHSRERHEALGMGFYDDELSAASDTVRFE